MKTQRLEKAFRSVPETLRVWLEALPDRWLLGNEGPETFSPRDVRGHLIHGERTDWIPRPQLILGQGVARPFELFDRFADRSQLADRTVAELLNEVGALRAAILQVVRAWRLAPAQLDLGCHPALGEVTLRELLATWVVHDLATWSRWRE